MFPATTGAGAPGAGFYPGTGRGARRLLFSASISLCLCCF